MYSYISQANNKFWIVKLRNIRKVLDLPDTIRANVDKVLLTNALTSTGILHNSMLYSKDHLYDTINEMIRKRKLNIFSIIFDGAVPNRKAKYKGN